MNTAVVATERKIYHLNELTFAEFEQRISASSGNWDAPTVENYAKCILYGDNISDTEQEALLSTLRNLYPTAIF